LNNAYRSLLIIAALVAWGCGSNPAAPAPAIRCPAPQTVVSPSGAPVTVTYAPPAAAGGPGLTSSCSPASGSTFTLGTTTVSCSAVVADQQVGCTFTVSVAAPPRLDATKLLAFGDSITYGSLGTCPGQSVDDVRSLWTATTPPGTSYPSVLQTGLESRYTAQSPSVMNEGFPGERVTDSAAMARFIARLNDRAPEVLLLQEGVNDLHAYGPDAVPVVAANLRTMIRIAKGRAVTVLVATLLPERPGGCRYSPQAELIVPTNDQIRAMAVAEDVELVDLYAAFDGHTAVLLAQDGLHPSQAGYAAIAMAFFASIQQTLENPPPSAP
jgi:lysophospholipase L1-like esterase